LFSVRFNTSLVTTNVSLDTMFLHQPAYAITNNHRPHGNKTLMEKTSSLNEQEFFIRAMYKHSY